MSLYLTRARYSPEACKGMLANPGDRSSAAKAMFEAAGIKLHHIWMTGPGEVITIVEGNAVSGTAVSMVVMASGAFSEVDSVELITPDQHAEAMKLGGRVASKYRAPGK